MFEVETQCVCSASILLRGVEGRIVWYYTKYDIPWHGIFAFLL